MANVLIERSPPVHGGVRWKRGEKFIVNRYTSRFFFVIPTPSKVGHDKCTKTLLKCTIPLTMDLGPKHSAGSKNNFQTRIWGYPQISLRDILNASWAVLGPFKERHGVGNGTPWRFKGNVYFITWSIRVIYRFRNKCFISGWPMYWSSDPHPFMEAALGGFRKRYIGN